MATRQNFLEKSTQLAVGALAAGAIAYSAARVRGWRASHKFPRRGSANNPAH
jgi:hypothetical protein